MEGCSSSEILREAILEGRCPTTYGQERNRQQWRERTIWKGEWQLLLGDLDAVQTTLQKMRDLEKEEPNWDKRLCRWATEFFDVKVKLYLDAEGLRVTLSSHKCRRPISFRVRL